MGFVVKHRLHQADDEAMNSKAVNAENFTIDAFPTRILVSKWPLIAIHVFKAQELPLIRRFGLSRGYLVSDLGELLVMLKAQQTPMQ